MIRSYKNKMTEKLAQGAVLKGFPADLVRPLQRKLTFLHTAAMLDDLRAPPGNRLEALTGDRQGQYSIRINKQWRICFEWSEDGADNVEVVDYHR